MARHRLWLWEINVRVEPEFRHNRSLTRFGWKSIGRVGLDIDILDPSDSATQDGPHLPWLDRRC